MNANANANPYQLTMEDRMRWAHISDVVKSAAIVRNTFNAFHFFLN